MQATAVLKLDNFSQMIIQGLSNQPFLFIRSSDVCSSYAALNGSSYVNAVPQGMDDWFARKMDAS